jgi:DNA-binding CsgD family transcriptional regulator
MLCLLAEGCTNADIAVGHGTSERVVHFHLSQLLARAQTASRSEIVRRARGKGWLV